MLRYVPLVNRLVSGDATQSINLPSVEVHDVETAPEKRPRTLKHLLRANHVNHSIIYHDLRFDNHTPHILCSAYLMGADSERLYHIYEVESKTLDPWVESPSEILQEDWRDFLGDKHYQRAYVDFFEDALALRYQYDWKKVVEEFMFGGKEPLINGLIGGLGHPLIHLGYAYEMNSKEIATEALGLAAVQYNFFHKYLDDKSYTKPAPFSSTSIRELLGKLGKDTRFNNLFKEPGFSNVDTLFEKHEDLVLEYWNAWTMEDPLKQFEESQEAAVDLLVNTVKPGTHKFDFFTCHLLTTSHAVRILLPFIPAKFHISLVRQWWLLTLAVHIANLRPEIVPAKPGGSGGRSWSDAEDKALNSSFSTDAHYVKAIRAIREAAKTWGDDDERYLTSALTFADEFKGWSFD